MIIDQAHAKTHPNEPHQQVLRHIKQSYGRPSADPRKSLAHMPCKLHHGRLPPKDEMLAFQQSPIDQLASRERMMARQGDPKPSAGHRLRIATRCRDIIGDEGDVEPPRHHPSRELARRAIEELNGHLRLIRTKLDQKISEKAWKEGGKNANAKEPLRPTAGRRRILYRLIDLPKPHARALKKALTGDRRPNAIRMTLEQRNAEFVLQRLNAPTDRRLPHPETPGRETKARVVCDRQRLRNGEIIDYALVSYFGCPARSCPQPTATLARPI